MWSRTFFTTLSVIKPKIWISVLDHLSFNMIKIKRENWKGKYVITVRDEGRIVSHARAIANFTIYQARQRYQERGTLSLRYERLVTSFSTTNTKEISLLSDKRGNVRISEKQKAQYVVKIYGPKGKELVTARSHMMHPTEANRDKMHKQAWDRAYARLAKENNLAYDSDPGEKLFKNGNYKVKEGFVYYRRD